LRDFGDSISYCVVTVALYKMPSATLSAVAFQAQHGYCFQI